MRAELSVVGIVLAACTGGGSDAAVAEQDQRDASSAAQGNGAAPDAAQVEEDAGQAVADASANPPSASGQASGANPPRDAAAEPASDTGADPNTGAEPDAGAEPERAAAFYFLETLDNELVGDDPMASVQGFMELYGGSADSVFGVSSVVVTDATGVRIGAQVFRWTPGGEVITLDDNTPWKQLHFADGAARWLVGERGSGSGTAQAFVWSDAAGLQEIEIGNGLPVSARGVSRDGRVVAGDAQGAAGWQIYRWTQADGARFLDLPAGDQVSGSSSLSADGSTVFGTSGLPAASGASGSAAASQCYRWVEGAAPQLIELPSSVDGWPRSGCGVTRTPAADGSATGGTVAFLDPEFPTSKARWQAFHWSETDGVSLIELPGFAHTHAHLTSADGRGVYGQAVVDTSSTSGAQPFHWTVEAGAVALGIPSGASNAELLATEVRPRPGISEDGQTVVGNTRGGAILGFLWSTRDGLVTLRPLPGDDASLVTHLEASGQVAAGFSLGDEAEAVLWDRSGEARSIRALLAAAGVEIDGFRFDTQFDTDVAVFDGGKRVLGTGTTADGIAAAWVAQLP